MLYQEIERYRLYFSRSFPILLAFLESFKIFLINLVIILMMSAKMATPDLLKVTTFWNKSYDVIISVDDVSNKILSCDSIHIDKKLVSVAFLWEKLSQLQFYKDFTRKTVFIEGWSWFKFNNLGLALGTNLKFYTSLSKGLKLKVRKFWRLIPTFVEVTGEKLAFLPPSLPHPE